MHIRTFNHKIHTQTLKMFGVFNGIELAATTFSYECFSFSNSIWFSFRQKAKYCFKNSSARDRPKFKNLFAYSKNNDIFRADFYIYTQNGSLVNRHTRLLSLAQRRPHLLGDSLDSFALSSFNGVGSFVARSHRNTYMHTHTVFPLSHSQQSHRAIYFLFYFVLLLSFVFCLFALDLPLCSSRLYAAFGLNLPYNLISCR